MFRTISALTCYFAAFVFIYAGYTMPEFEALNTGWPAGPREITCALLLVNGMAAKLMGHVALLSTTKAR